MSKVRGYLFLTLIFLLLVAGCTQGLATPSPTSLPTPTPTVTPSPTSVTTLPAEEVPFAWDPWALDTLDSYTHHLRMELLANILGILGDIGPPPGKFERYSQIQNRPTRAQQSVATYTVSYPPGYAGTSEEIYLFDEGKGWIRSREGEEEEEWREIVVRESHFGIPFVTGGLWDAYAKESLEGFEFIGVEMVNGVSTYHYQKKGFNLGEAECTFPSASEDWWVAVEGDYPVKGTLDASGTCEGEGVEIHLLEEIDKINQPVDISPPV